MPAVLVTGLVLLAGCGSSSAPASSPAATSAPNAAPQTGNPTSPVTLTEDGSSLLAPYLQVLVDQFHSSYPNITLQPAAGGSGKGIADAISGTVTMGGSDAYLTDAQASQNSDILNLPIVISSQGVFFNLPGISSLKLTGDVIAKIYEGHITSWNDAAIAALNPGVTLPSTPIVPLRRVDASGDTFIFTSFLSKTNAEWNSGPAFSTSITWPPARGELTGNGNPNMVQICAANPGCIAYVGVSALAAAQKANLGEAYLQNKAGNYVEPVEGTVDAAVSTEVGSLPADLRAPIIYEDGDQSYPIVNYEYLMVKSDQSDPNVALALRDFFVWAVDPTKGATTANLAAVSFDSLPTAVVPRVLAAAAKIKAS